MVILICLIVSIIILSIRFFCMWFDGGQDQPGNNWNTKKTHQDYDTQLDIVEYTVNCIHGNSATPTLYNR